MVALKPEPATQIIIFEQVGVLQNKVNLVLNQYV